VQQHSRPRFIQGFVVAIAGVVATAGVRRDWDWAWGCLSASVTADAIAPASA